MMYRQVPTQIYDVLSHELMFYRVSGLNLAVSVVSPRGSEGANSWYYGCHTAEGRALSHHTRFLTSCVIDVVA